MESGFPSPRTDVFPAGLRVLVVDDDPTWLKILEKMLKKCSYEVTTCCLARDALNLLRERKDGFDIVISDVNMPDMDGFKLLELVGLEMDLPVIMMSVDGETSRVMKGVQHGACDYLLKPVRMKELKNIWQHVFRKRIHEVKDIENYESSEDIQMMRNGSEKFDDRHLIGGGDMGLVKKRKDTENKEHDDQDVNDPSSMKKPRVVWSVDLHQKFVKAVDQIGFEKAGPKKILDLMNVPWLSRENVASHLQKYRLYWSRLQKQNEPNTSYGGIKQPEFTSNDPAASFELPSSVTMHQNSFGYSGNKIHVQDAGPGKHEGSLKGSVSFLPVTEPRKGLIGDCLDTQKTTNGSQMSFTHSFGSLGRDINYTSLESIVPKHHSWAREMPMMQFMQQQKMEHQPHGYTHLPLPGPQHHMQADQPHTPLVNSETSITGTDKVRHSEIEPLCTEYRSNHVRNESSIGHSIESLSAQAETEILNLQPCGPMSTIAKTPAMKNYSLDQNSVSNWESNQQNIIPGSGSSDLQSSHEDLKQCPLQDYDYIENFGLNNREILDYHDLELFTELSQSYDMVRFSYDYFCDSVEHPITDQGLFIV